MCSGFSGSICYHLVLTYRMKRTHSPDELPEEVTTGEESPPSYPRVVLAWHRARPTTWNAQQAFQFLQTCHHLHQLALSIPVRLREHRQKLAITFQLPPVAVRKFLDNDLFGLTATLVFVVAYCACCSEIDLLHAVPRHLRLCGSLAATITQHFPAIQKQLLLWTESLAILVSVLQFPGRAEGSDASVCTLLTSFGWYSAMFNKAFRNTFCGKPCMFSPTRKDETPA